MKENKMNCFEYQKPVLIKFEQYLNLVRGNSCFGADSLCPGGDVCGGSDGAVCPVGDI